MGEGGVAVKPENTQFFLNTLYMIFRKKVSARLFISIAFFDSLRLYFMVVGNFACLNVCVILCVRLCVCVCVYFLCVCDDSRLLFVFAPTITAAAMVLLEFFC